MNVLVDMHILLVEKLVLHINNDDCASCIEGHM